MESVREKYRRELRRIVGTKRAVKAVGLPSHKIDEIEIRRGKPLPESYRAMLEVLGASPDDSSLFLGTDVYYPEALELDNWAEQINHDAGQDVIKPTDTVVAIHQGYIVFFLRGSGDDPPVYGWREGDAEVRRVAASLLEWIDSEAMTD